MAIVNKNGLVGIIDKVYENYSTFKLLTTLNDNKIYLSINDFEKSNNLYYGYIKYYFNNFELKIFKINKDEKE